jgi:hypothetical protein
VIAVAIALAVVGLVAVVAYLARLDRLERSNWREQARPPRSVVFDSWLDQEPPDWRWPS